MNGVAEPPPRQVGTIVVRPVRPADEILLERFSEHLSVQTRRTRFFAMIRGLTAAQSVGFCTLDLAECRRAA